MGSISFILNTSLLSLCSSLSGLIDHAVVAFEALSGDDGVLLLRHGGILGYNLHLLKVGHVGGLLMNNGLAIFVDNFLSEQTLLV